MGEYIVSSMSDIRGFPERLRPISDDIHNRFTDFDSLIVDSGNDSMTVREVVSRFEAVKALLWPILDDLVDALDDGV